jgi:hypothetical protein
MGNHQVKQGCSNGLRVGNMAQPARSLPVLPPLAGGTVLGALMRRSLDRFRDNRKGRQLRRSSLEAPSVYFSPSSRDQFSDTIPRQEAREEACGEGTRYYEQYVGHKPPDARFVPRKAFVRLAPQKGQYDGAVRAEAASQGSLTHRSSSVPIRRSSQRNALSSRYRILQQGQALVLHDLHF